MTLSALSQLITRCLRREVTLGMEEVVIIKRYAKIHRVLNKTPYLGVLQDGSNMMISEKNIKMADGLILWMVNCDPKEGSIKSTVGGFKFQVQRVNDGTIAHRLPGAWQNRDTSSGACSTDAR